MSKVCVWTTDQYKVCGRKNKLINYNISITFSGTQYDTQYPCHAGSYYNDTGLIRYEDCIDCPVGNYCPAGSELPTVCPAYVVIVIQELFTRA